MVHLVDGSYPRNLVAKTSTDSFQSDADGKVDLRQVNIQLPADCIYWTAVQFTAQSSGISLFSDMSGHVSTLVYLQNIELTYRFSGDSGTSRGYTAMEELFEGFKVVNVGVRDTSGIGGLTGDSFYAYINPEGSYITSQLRYLAYEF